MYDHQTGTYWFQVAGEAVVRTMTGSHFDSLPSATMPCGRWKSLHPDTLLLTGVEGGLETFLRGPPTATVSGAGTKKS